MNRSPLSGDRIIDACVELIVRDGARSVSMRRLGAKLGVDATAVYRHFPDKDTLMRAVGDRMLASVVVGLPAPRAGWRSTITETCERLRAVLITQRSLAPLVQHAPPMATNEFAITELLLSQLRRAGLSEGRAALAYHALIELTVGSASLDAPVAALDPRTRATTYARWRSAYAALDPASHPSARALASELYPGSADDRFRFALDALLTGVRSR